MSFMNYLIFISSLSLIVWLYLFFFNGRFWMASERLNSKINDMDAMVWPEVVAIIPARNEEETIGAVSESHLKTLYKGRFSLIIVDDQSTDKTAAILQEKQKQANRPFYVKTARDLPEVWSGKLWAVHNGLEAAKNLTPEAAYVLLTDADIIHSPESLEKLVFKAVSEKRVLVSVMAKLDARGFWGSLLMPAFIFFFQKLYPFASTNNKNSQVAGAAGGCMLIERAILDEIGGVNAIRSSLIDDCSLALSLKDPKGAKRSIWLGFYEGIVSLRDNRSLSTIWKMVARTAFTQLHFSNFYLLGSLLGMVVTYLAAPLIVVSFFLHQNMSAFYISLAAWILSIISYYPTLRLYNKSAFWLLLLPLSACYYMTMTFSSAFKYWKGKGGAWKGRTY